MFLIITPLPPVRLAGNGRAVSNLWGTAVVERSHTRPHHNKKQEDMTLKTENQKKQEATDAAIYRDWLKLTANPENSRTVVTERLMKKYGKCSSTIWKARNRAEARLKAQMN